MIIGTRGSELARKQSEIVSKKLREKNPDISIDIKIIKTEGDVNMAPIPSDVMGKGWFTKEIEKELLAGTIDIAVHSLKDLPEELPPGLSIGAYPEREDARDVLVSKNSIHFKDLKSGAVIGTDSPRRTVQLKAMRSDIGVKSIRGNVPTRIEKMDKGEYDAVVLAAAGLNRLQLEHRITEYFDGDVMTPAPGQGILAVEYRTNDEKTGKIVASIMDTTAEHAARAERAFSSKIGGGCKQPVGAYMTIEGDTFTLKAVIAFEDSSKVIRDSVSGPIEKSIELSIDLAQKMLQELGSKK